MVPNRVFFSLCYEDKKSLSSCIPSFTLVNRELFNPAATQRHASYQRSVKQRIRTSSSLQSRQHDSKSSRHVLACSCFDSHVQVNKNYAARPHVAITPVFRACREGSSALLTIQHVAKQFHVSFCSMTRRTGTTWARASSLAWATTRSVELLKSESATPTFVARSGRRPLGS